MSDKHTINALQTGIIIGMNESLVALNKFLDTKRNDGHSDYITHTELNTFMKMLISQKEKSIEQFKLS